MRPLRVRWFVLVSLVTAWAEVKAQTADTDRDGINDEVERSGGTDPLDSDSDGDGAPDGQEDRNRDGVVDPGETDPRVHGLFPGEYPYIPEPMVFDLVRGLGAKKGELEANVLFFSRLRRRHALIWAPEVEFAFADGYGLEFELPMSGTELEALKVAVQGTVPEGRRQFIHGWQAMGEYHLVEAALQTTWLYLAGGRLGRGLSLFTMLGTRITFERGAKAHSPAEIIANPSVHFNFSERITAGVETNLAADRRRVYFMAMPQVHVQLRRHLRLQTGGGVDVWGRRASPVVSARVVLE